MTAALGSQRPRLEVSPERPCLDTELHIRLDGLPPGSEVTLRASQADPRGRQWRSAATFAAAADGTVDLVRDAPRRGNYLQADPMALVWSMEPSAAQPPGGPADFLAPARLRVVAAVLLISGSDDQGYGPAFHDIAARRFAGRHHRHRWNHVVYQDAGHLIAVPPYEPSTRSLTPGPGVTFRHGGTPAADARARAEGWRQIQTFLAEELTATSDHPR